MAAAAALFGGVYEWTAITLAAATLALAAWIRPTPWRTSGFRALDRALLALLAAIALQLVPLPAALMSAVSPARLAFVRQTSLTGDVPSIVPLTLDPGATVHAWLGVFTACVTMGGAFDIQRFLDGYYDQNAYLLCPPHFLPGLSDPWFLDRYRANKWVFVTGEHDICRADTEHAASLLGAKGVSHSLHVWGHGSYHDWPEWRKMARAYIP